jgi:hypothetical protein
MASIKPSRRTLVAGLTALVAGVLPNRASARTNDPVWSERASPLAFAGPARHTPPGIAFDDLPPIDTILGGCWRSGKSHGHKCRSSNDLAHFHFLLDAVSI